MTAWADAIHASDLTGAIDPVPEAECPTCGEVIPAWRTHCDRCAKLDQYQQEFQAAMASKDDPRR